MKDKEIAERLNMGYKLAKYSPDVFLMYQHRFEKSTMTKWKAFLDGGAIFKYEENLRLTEEKKVAEQKAIEDRRMRQLDGIDFTKTTPPHNEQNQFIKRRGNNNDLEL